MPKQMPSDGTGSSLVCLTCSAELLLTELHIEALLSTVEGRKLVRAAIQKVDRRLEARPPATTNTGLLARVVEHLSRLRQEACLPQAALARQLGVSEWTVHRWEKCRGPGVDACEKWAQALGTSLKAILIEVAD
jgi:DNA-binding transcriptional regulator YiaG